MTLKAMAALSALTLWIAHNPIPLYLVMVVLGLNFLRDMNESRKALAQEDAARMAAPDERIVVMNQDGAVVFAADPMTGEPLTHATASTLAETARQGWIVTTGEAIARQEAANAYVNSRNANANADADTQPLPAI